MSTDLCNHQWYALRTRPRFEKLVSRQLRGEGYDEYLPVNKSRRCWSGRIGTAEMPIFAGYTFGKFHIQDRLPILMVPGVLHIVGTIEAGQSVSIERGPLAGVIGTIVRKTSRSRLILSVALLQRSVAGRPTRRVFAAYKFLRGFRELAPLAGNIRCQVVQDHIGQQFRPHRKFSISTPQ